MSKTKMWNRITLEDVLRVDSFDQQIFIYDPIGHSKTPMVQDRQEFFTQIYSEPMNSDVEIIDGSQSNCRKVKIEKWLSEDITNTENSLVIFIEGYAGCGKSTFVQHLLSQQLDTYNYDYHYYNYDIGAYYDNKDSHRITGAIRECFIQQLLKCILINEVSIIKKFVSLLAQYEVKYLDTTLDIYNEFVNTETFKESLLQLYKEKDEASFRSVMHKQLKCFSCEQILALDYLFRLSKYIESDNHNNSLLYICYDNMDSIENFDELNVFDNTLVSLRKNIDEYINQTSKNYYGMPMPRFIIMATYRKITAAKVDLSAYSERMDDQSEYNQYIQYIDASHVYSYYNIIDSREKYFSDYIRRRKLEGQALLNKLNTVNELTNAEFIHNRYAGLWNNNYRTCSTIMDRIFQSYTSEAEICKSLICKKIDGYDEKSSTYFGASAIFFSLVCKIFNQGGLWGQEHMNLVPLNVTKENKNISELTSLSRLILTYVSNIRDSQGKRRPVSTLEIFQEFDDLFTADDICRCLSNMLARDKTDTWRRPIYYHRNALNDDENIEIALKRQWRASKQDESNPVSAYTELLLCECGYAYIERLMAEFEFFSNRISNSNKCLYLLTNISEIEHIIDGVYEAVQNCCQDMINFSQIYMAKKEILDYNQYIKLPIHPRTRFGKSQLHTERIIFSHISYLDHCRAYFIDQAKSLDDKKKINEMFVDKIDKYLGLYINYIQPINTSRTKVAENLSAIIQDIRTGKTEEVIFQAISCAGD